MTADNGSHHEQIRDAILDLIKDLPAADRAVVMEVANRMRELVWCNGHSGQLALALIGAEVAMGKDAR